MRTIKRLAVVLGGLFMIGLVVAGMHWCKGLSTLDGETVLTFATGYIACDLFFATDSLI